MPVSITVRMPGTVSEVSATLVARTIRRPVCGAKTRCWSAAESLAYKGRTSVNRNRIALIVLAVALAGVAYRAWSSWSPSTGTAVATSNTGGTAQRSTGTVASLETPDVRLSTLNHERIKPSGADRNLFRFKVKVLPPPDAAATAPAAPLTPAGPAAPPALPPIALKFIGVVVTTEKSLTYAVLRDDRGVYHGREGDIIEGRYRILKIGAESIELAYVDGRGRQTIRLGS